MPRSNSSRTSHGSLTSGYMDEDGPAGPVERYKYRQLSPIRERREENEYHIPPSQRRGRKLDIDPYKFPMLPSPSSNDVKVKDAKDNDAKDARPKPKFDFTSEQLWAMGVFLQKAPAVIAERKAARAAEEAKIKKQIETIKAMGGDVERFKKAKMFGTGGAGAGSYQKVRSLLNSQYAQEDKSESEDEQPIFRPRKKIEQPSKTRTETKKKMQQSIHVPEAVAGVSDIDEDPHFIANMFLDTANDALAAEDAVPAVEAERSANTKLKKHKKQRRKVARAREIAEQLPQEITHTKSREQSPSPGSKVHGWEMDPVAKPTSQASTMSLQQGGWDGPGEADAWAGADIGGMFEQSERGSSSHHSQRKSSAAQSKQSPPVNDIAGRDEHNRTSSRHHSRSGEGSRRSGSRRDSAKSAVGATTLETIQEEPPFVGGWGEEQVWEPPKSSPRKDSSSNRSHGDAASHSRSQSRRYSSSHRSHRSAAPQPAAHSQQGSRRISSHSRRSVKGDPAAKSPTKGSLASYQPPTVHEVPDQWSGGDGAAEWDKQPEKSHSHRSSQSRRSRSSFEQAVNQAGYADERAISYRSHRSHHTQGGKSKAHSYRSKSTEKVDKWFESVPVPSVKALSGGQVASQAGSHRSSQRSRKASGVDGWENAEVPPDASVGTGYGKKGEDTPAGAWDQRVSSKSGGSRDGGAVREDEGAWDDKTSTGSSTKADVGVKPLRSRSHRSSRDSQRPASGTSKQGAW